MKTTSNQPHQSTKNMHSYYCSVIIGYLLIHVATPAFGAEEVLSITFRIPIPQPNFEFMDNCSQIVLPSCNDAVLNKRIMDFNTEEEFDLLLKSVNNSDPFVGQSADFHWNEEIVITDISSAVKLMQIQYKNMKWILKSLQHVTLRIESLLSYLTIASKLDQCENKNAEGLLLTENIIKIVEPQGVNVKEFFENSEFACFRQDHDFVIKFIYTKHTEHFLNAISGVCLSLIVFAFIICLKCIYKAKSNAVA